MSEVVTEVEWTPELRDRVMGVARRLAAVERDDAALTGEVEQMIGLGVLDTVDLARGLLELRRAGVGAVRPAVLARLVNLGFVTVTLNVQPLGIE